MAQGVKHDYHLVNPSPWPLVGSVGATIMFMGLVVWMKGAFGIEKGFPWLFFGGLALMLYTMFGWWMRRSPRKPMTATTPPSSRSACATA
jgi:cytochrome c oxidase subunit 3